MRGRYRRGPDSSKMTLRESLHNVHISNIKQERSKVRIPPSELFNENIKSLLREDPSKLLKQSVHGTLFDCSSRNTSRVLRTPSEAFGLLPESFPLHKIKGLSLARQPLSFIKDLLLGLTIINVSSCSLTTLRGIGECRNLQFLNADKNKIQLLIPLIGLDQLRELHIAYNPLKGLKEVLKLRALAMLDVSGCQCVRQLNDLRLLSQCKCLKEIRIKDTDLEDVRYSEVRGVCPNIVRIDDDYVFSMSDFKEIPAFTLSDSVCTSICTLKTSVYYSKRRNAKSESRNFTPANQESIDNLVADENPSGLPGFHRFNTTLSIKSNKHPLRSTIQRVKSAEKEPRSGTMYKDESCSSRRREARSGTSVESASKKDSRKSCDSEDSLSNGRKRAGRK